MPRPLMARLYRSLGPGHNPSWLTETPIADHADALAPSNHVVFALRKRVAPVRFHPWIAAAVAFSLYFATMCPTVHWSDSAEYAAAGATLGLSHPPGSPLYTMLAWLASRLPFEPAYSINLLSAASCAIAVALCYRIQLTLGASTFGAACGAALFATCPLLWVYATASEVYGPATVFELLTFLLLLRAFYEHRPRLCLLAGTCAGLGMGVHYGLATFGLGYALLVGATIVGDRRPRRCDIQPILALSSKTLGCVLLGASVLLWVPWRASSNPTPAVNPLGVSNVEGGFWMLRGGVYDTWFHRELDWWGQVGWVLRVELMQLAWVGIIVAAIGLVALAQSRQRVAALALLLVAIGNTWFFFDYAAFHLGAPSYGEAGSLDPAYYREADVFFLPTVVVLCCAVGPGLDWLRRRFATRVSSRAITALGVILVLALGIRGGTQFTLRDRSDDWTAYEFGQRVVSELPDNPVILNYTTSPEWKPGTVFHHYFVEVLGLRRDVTVVNMPPVHYVDWLLQQGFAVFVYNPVPGQTDRWSLAPQAGLFRLQPAPATSASLDRR